MSYFLDEAVEHLANKLRLQQDLVLMYACECYGVDTSSDEEVAKRCEVMIFKDNNGRPEKTKEFKIDGKHVCFFSELLEEPFEVSSVPSAAVIHAQWQCSDLKLPNGASMPVNDLLEKLESN